MSLTPTLAAIIQEPSAFKKYGSGKYRDKTQSSFSLSSISKSMSGKMLISKRFFR